MPVSTNQLSIYKLPSGALDSTAWWAVNHKWCQSFAAAVLPEACALIIDAKITAEEAHWLRRAPQEQ